MVVVARRHEAVSHVDGWVSGLDKLFIDDNELSVPKGCGSQSVQVAVEADEQILVYVLTDVLHRRVNDQKPGQGQVPRGGDPMYGEGVADVQKGFLPPLPAFEKSHLRASSPWDQM